MRAPSWRGPTTTWRACLQRGKKPLFLAVNKVEGAAMEMVAENFRQLGIREVYPISSEHGLGIGDLLDAIAEAVPVPETESEEELGRRGRDIRGRTAGAGQRRERCSRRTFAKREA